jgi:signal transduction histidine kinase
VFLELGPGHALSRMVAAAWPGVSSRTLDDFKTLEGARAGREAIRNACLHSGGSRLEVELVYDAHLTLRVRDNGIDASVAMHGKEGHFGIQGMGERAAGLGGTLKLARATPVGTELTVVVRGGVAYRRSRRYSAR